VIEVRPVVVKLGGSVITEKSRAFSVRRGTLARIARELSGSREGLVVVHGGGSFGHPVAKRYGLAEGFRDRRQLRGLAETHMAMVRLNSEVVRAMISSGIPAVSVQPSACMTTRDGRIARAELSPLRRMLSLGLVPVLFGDVVPDERRGFSILSGDQIVAFLAVRLRARRVVVGADVDGVFTADPRRNRDAELLRRVTPADLQRMRFSSPEVDVTGGMAAKLRELFYPASRGIHAEIVNATRPGVLARAIRGESNLGTVVSPG